MKRQGINCYRCGKNGYATWKEERPHGKDGWGHGSWKRITTGDVKGVESVDHYLWLCPECDDFRCEACDILLSNEFVCGARHNKIHGAYTEETLPLCKDCYLKEL